MRYLDEFRNGEIAQRMAREIHAVATRRWKIMEICGGQTHSIIKNGIDQMLPAGIEMVHGPGCPVCVTPLELIDKALAIANYEKSLRLNAKNGNAVEMLRKLRQP